MSDLPRYTLVHRPPRRTRARGGAPGTAPTFLELTVAELRQVLSEFPFRRSINEVHLHHTWRPNHAQYRGHASIVAMWRHHVETNGWSDIAQHVSIGPEGSIWTGRDWNVAPASAAGHNGNAAFGPFMIEMIGDFDEGRDRWEGEQRTAALDVIAAVQARFGLPSQALRFHNQMSTKTCPGSSLNRDGVVAAVEERAVQAKFGLPSHRGDGVVAEGERRARSIAAPPSATRAATVREALKSLQRKQAAAEGDTAEPLERGAGLERAAGAVGAAETARAAARGRPRRLRGMGAWLADSPASPKAIRVGIWDLDAYVGALPQAIAAVNAAQDRYLFFEAMAAIPAGIISEPSRVRAWYRSQTGQPAAPGVARNVIAEDFFQRAAAVRRDLGLDYLAGVTASLVAGEEEEYIYYNLFSISQGRLLLVSSQDLREYARKAGRPFEACVLGVAVAQLLAARHRRLLFHEDRGCLFDYNEKRSSIVKTLKTPRIEPECLALIPAADRAAASALVGALDAYKGGRP